MTPIGTLIFGAIGVLFISGVIAMIWWAMRGNDAMKQALQRDGWTVTQAEPGGAAKWSARREKDHVVATIEVSTSGVRNKSVWTRVCVNAATEAADVLVERSMPGLLASDGAVAGLLGFKPPPRWNGASPALAAGHTAYASSDSAAALWLSELNQSAIVEFNQGAAHRVSIRFFEGVIEARWAQEPRDATQIGGIIALLRKLRS